MREDKSWQHVLKSAAESWALYFPLGFPDATEWELAVWYAPFHMLCTNTGQKQQNQATVDQAY